MLQIDKYNPLASHSEKTSYGIPKQLITVIPSQRMRCWETRSGRNTYSFCTHFLFFKVKIKTESRPWDVEIGRWPWLMIVNLFGAPVSRFVRWGVKIMAQICVTWESHAGMATEGFPRAGVIVCAWRVLLSIITAPSQWRWGVAVLFVSWKHGSGPGILFGSRRNLLLREHGPSFQLSLESALLGNSKRKLARCPNTDFRGSGDPRKDCPSLDSLGPAGIWTLCSQ